MAKRLGGMKKSEVIARVAANGETETHVTYIFFTFGPLASSFALNQLRIDL